MRTMRLAILVAIAFAACPRALQAVPAQDRETGAITGRVMLDGKPAQGVTVTATQEPRDPSKAIERILKPAAGPRATTDSDGRYTIDNLPLGKYLVRISSKVLIDTTSGENGLEISITDSSTVDKVDFSLVKTGVITGRITDSEGRPVISEQVVLKSPSSGPSPDDVSAIFSMTSDRMYYTDDRGIYRIYGLRPGRYTVSAGRSEDSMFDVLLRRPKRARTYYPGVPDEASAKAVEVTPGSEITGIDIKLGVADKGFVVAGRVLDAEGRGPVGGIVVSYSKAAPATAAGSEPSDQDNDHGSDFSLSGAVTTTNARGEFRFESVAPGSYKVEASSVGDLTGANGFFADPVNFQVQYANVDKLEINIHRGASISGTVTLENPNGPDSLDDAAGLLLLASVSDTSMRPVSQAVARVSGDFSFQMSGLKPGKVKIGALPYGPQRFAVLRVEHNGSPVPDGVPVQANEQVAGLRVILTPANCTIRGRVVYQEDSLRRGSSNIFVSIKASTSSTFYYNPYSNTVADSKGDFVIENLGPGTYDVTAQDEARGALVKQTVTVSSGGTAEVTLVLQAKPKGNDN